MAGLNEGGYYNNVAYPTPRGRQPGQPRRWYMTRTSLSLRRIGTPRYIALGLVGIRENDANKYNAADVRAGYALRMPSRSSTDTTGMTACSIKERPISSLGSSKKPHADTPNTHGGRAALCTNSTHTATQHFATIVLDTLLDPIHLAHSDNPRYRSFGGQFPMGKTRPLYQLDPPSTTDLRHDLPMRSIYSHRPRTQRRSTPQDSQIPIPRGKDRSSCIPRGTITLGPSPRRGRTPQRLTVAMQALAAQAWTMHTLFTPIPDRDMNPQRPAGGFSLSGHEPETRVAPLIKFKVFLSRERPSHQGYNRNVQKHRFCSSYPPGIRSPNDMWTFWKEGTHGNGAWRLCEGDKYKSPMKSLQYSSSELALLILVAFTKRTPSYADTPSCSSGNLVKVHLANRLHPPERTKATPLAVHRILVDVEAVCGVSRLADPSPRSLAQRKGESIGVEKKQRL
ncbi:hypothetical protein DFH09DRAFT_1068819 [Mycena vulgaris]|nr:hypothetical protein DFH09DRAFT_1068819 [Mycena vulgaris]